MRLSLAAFALAASAPAVVGFSTQTNKISSFALRSTMEPPERTAPDAGYIPEWENRPGLTPEEYMASDMSKPDLSGMWECPLTRWDSSGYVRNNIISLSRVLNHICSDRKDKIGKHGSSRKLTIK